RRQEPQRARHARGDVVLDLVDLLLARLAVVDPHEAAERAAERRQARSAAHRIAAADEHARPERGHLDALQQLDAHAALADAGGPGDERRARRAVLDQLGVDALEERDLLVAADRRRGAA